MLEELDADVLVAGGGVGGLMAAYHAQRLGARVVLLSGSGGASQRISSMNTALGHESADTPAGLFDDIFKAGGYVGSPHVVAALAHRIGAETERLVELGVPFTRRGGTLARRRATGSTWTRAVFTDGMVGVDIARALGSALATASAPPVVQVNGGLLLDLEVTEGRISGALAYTPRKERWLSVRAPSVVLATGGAGQLFGTTTNPRGSRGIGYAAALEAGAELVDMEFVSFEPFVTSAPEELRGQDLPTTVLFEGARLYNGAGDEFIDTASSPSKDVICRAMVREVLEGRGTASGSVYFDLRDMEPENANRYVGIVEALRTRGIAIDDALLEVMPAQHYMMGGVRIDSELRTSVPGLYAVGEVAGGAHGAHRLAGGGGMEVVAGGSIAGETAARDALESGTPAPSRAPAEPRQELRGVRLPERSKESLARIARALDSGCGILRNEADLTAAVDVIRAELDCHAAFDGDPFVRRSAAVAYTVARAALTRTESRGDHFRLDFPGRDDRFWLTNLAAKAGSAGSPEVWDGQAPTTRTCATEPATRN